jgi:type VI secretion system protein ImpH
MGTESGASPTDLRLTALEESLDNVPESFTFFQAVRLLHRRFPERRRIGEFAHPSEEVVRISVNPSLAFPAGDVQMLRLDPESPPELQVNFMGLVGHMGVLPVQYSLLMDERGAAEGEREPFRDFLDIFHHRMLSLFYKAWERSHHWVVFERGEEDRFTSRLMDLVGIGPGDLRHRMGIRDEALLFYSGLLGAQQRSALSLEQLLEDHFQVPVGVEQFVGGWYGLSSQARCRLDDDEDMGGSLGEGTVVGEEIWDPHARLRIKIGPVRRDRYDEFLPGGISHGELREITRFFSDGQFDFEVQLILDRRDVPGMVLGEEGDGALPLGWCTWIRTQPPARDAGETTFMI